MISLKQFMETVNYRITEGSEYGWQCYGPDAYMLDSWNGEPDGHSFTIIFDTKTQTVYEVQAHDYVHNRAYRMINPDYAKANKKEAKQRGVSRKEAWDDVDYVDLESYEDWLSKAQAIFAGNAYDTRVDVPLDLEDDLVFEMMKQAHERDITLNQYVELILKQTIDKHQDTDSFEERMWKQSVANVG
jgi:hypothetical protein